MHLFVSYLIYVGVETLMEDRRITPEGKVVGMNDFIAYITEVIEMALTSSHSAQNLQYGHLVVSIVVVVILNASIGADGRIVVCVREYLTSLFEGISDWSGALVVSDSEEVGLLLGELASYLFLTLPITHFYYEGFSDGFVALVFSIIYL